MFTLKQLDNATRDKLRSTQNISSLPQIVSELVQNSLDAGSSNINIGVNLEEWSCWVRDDGRGISKDGLDGFCSENGGRYKTSKEYAPGFSNALSTFGFRGEALASIGDLSCLEICSRTSQSRNTWSIIRKGRKTLYTGPAVRWRRETPGTVVCVRDAFYNLPVRRKSHPTLTRTLDLIRQEIEVYALAFHEVTFVLEETGSKKQVMKISRSSSMLAAFRNIFGRALTEYIEEIDVSRDSMRLEGFLSLNGAQSRAHQFLYINRHILAVCDLHLLIESRFASSTFAKNALDEAGETGLPRSNVRRSPRKTEKKPVYVLNITIPPEDVDNLLEPTKTVINIQGRELMHSLVSTTIVSFLERNGFSQRNADSEHGTMSSPRKRRKHNPEFDTAYGPLDTSVSDMSALSIHDGSRKGNRASTHCPAQDGELEEASRNDSGSRKTLSTSSPVINSDRQETALCDFRGENPSSFPNSYGSRRTLRPCPSNNAMSTTDDNSMPDWLQTALQTNKVYAANQSQIPSMTQAGRDHVGHNNIPGDTHSLLEKMPNMTHIYRGIPGPNTTINTQRFTRRDLLHAKIINQVDRKFIACLLIEESASNQHNSKMERATQDDSHSQTSTLILIDQHAADERVRVERFLKELCLGFLHSRLAGKDPEKYIQTRQLRPPQPVLLTKHEALRLQKSKELQEAFALWGIRFSDLPQTASESLDDHPESECCVEYIQVKVLTIPEVVADKLVQENELQDLVKGYLNQLQMEVPTAIPTEESEQNDNRLQDEFIWLKAMRWCPQQLIELINSKACRGAIMFNDELTVEHCKKLVNRLSQTAFPFMCAHGRPSLVPLAGLGPLSRDNGRRREVKYKWLTLDNNGIFPPSQIEP